MPKNKRSLEDGYDMYNPAPFIENNPSFKYYADNINPIYVDNNTGEVWQNNKPKGSVVLPDIEVKGKNLKAIEAGRNINLLLLVEYFLLKKRLKKMLMLIM